MRHLALLLLALAALLAAAQAPGAPVPPLRSPRPAGGPLAPSPRSARLPPAADVLVTACGTRLESVAEALAAHAARAPVSPLATTQSVDAGGIAVLEDDGTFFYTNKGGQPLLDIAAVTQAFYRTHGDDYDFLAIYLASGMDQWLGSPGALAAAWPVRNDTQGIGLNLFDVGAAFGSPARLQNVTTMNALSRYPDDPDAPIGGPGDTFSTMDVLAHEIAHRWLAYTFVDSAGTPSDALLGRDWQHWSFFFDSDSSFMEGCDWTAAGSDSFVTTGVSSTFGLLDQYLMGMRTRAEIDSFFVVNEPTDLDPPGTYVPYSIPEVGVGCHGRATWWKVGDIERIHGPRVPDGAVAPRSFRLGIVLVVPHGSAPTPADLQKLGVIRTRIPQTFAAATWMRGSLDVTLDSRAGPVVIEHLPLPDTEDGSAPRTIAARVTIGPGGIPIHVDPASVQLHWRTGTTDPFSTVAMQPIAPDSFAATPATVLPAGVVQYWLAAASDSAGIAAQLPAAGAATPFQFTIGPDHVQPVVTHVTIPFERWDRMPQTLLARVTDNAGVDSVWCEFSVDGGSVTSMPATRAGHDSFTVTLGENLHPPQRLAYRFGARDIAAAANVGWSNPAFDTLRVGNDAYDDFENPTTYFHSNVLYSWRDSWHLDAATSSPAGGTAWHCGSDDGTPYEPHQDAAFVTPAFYAIGPGTLFRFDERHVLEQEDDQLAFDAARLEVQLGGGAWQVVEPTPGYTHEMDEGGMPFDSGSSCWSGDSHGWVTRSVDLSPYAPGPVRLRLRVCTDDLVGADGVWVDRVRVFQSPADTVAAVPGGTTAFAAGPAWPNPTRGALRLPLALPRRGHVEWTLHDIQGRRVAVLWSGMREAGPGVLSGEAPRALPAGLYFTRLAVDGRTRNARRVALTR